MEARDRLRTTSNVKTTSRHHGDIIGQVARESVDWTRNAQQCARARVNIQFNMKMNAKSIATKSFERSDFLIEAISNITIRMAMRWHTRYPPRKRVFTARQWALSHWFASNDDKSGGKQHENKAHERSHARPARVILNAAPANAHKDKVCVGLHDECTAMSPGTGRPRSQWDGQHQKL